MKQDVQVWDRNLLQPRRLSSPTRRGYSRVRCIVMPWMEELHRRRVSPRNNFLFHVLRPTSPSASSPAPGFPAWLGPFRASRLRWLRPSSSGSLRWFPGAARSSPPWPCDAHHGSPHPCCCAPWSVLPEFPAGPSSCEPSPSRLQQSSPLSCYQSPSSGTPAPQYATPWRAPTLLSGSSSPDQSPSAALPCAS